MAEKARPPREGRRARGPAHLSSPSPSVANARRGSAARHAPHAALEAKCTAIRYPSGIARLASPSERPATLRAPGPPPSLSLPLTLFRARRPAARLPPPPSPAPRQGRAHLGPDQAAVGARDLHPVRGQHVRARARGHASDVRVVAERDGAAVRQPASEQLFRLRHEPKGPRAVSHGCKRPRAATARSQPRVSGRSEERSVRRRRRGRLSRRTARERGGAEERRGRARGPCCARCGILKAGAGGRRGRGRAGAEGGTGSGWRGGRGDGEVGRLRSASRFPAPPTSSRRAARDDSTTRVRGANRRGAGRGQAFEAKRQEQRKDENGSEWKGRKRGRGTGGEAQLLGDEKAKGGDGRRRERGKKEESGQARFGWRLKARRSPPKRR